MLSLKKCVSDAHFAMGLYLDTHSLTTITGGLHSLNQCMAAHVPWSIVSWGVCEPRGDQSVGRSCPSGQGPSQNDETHCLQKPVLFPTGTFHLPFPCVQTISGHYARSQNVQATLAPCLSARGSSCPWCFKERWTEGRMEQPSQLWSLTGLSVETLISEPSLWPLRAGIVLIAMFPAPDQPLNIEQPHISCLQWDQPHW